MSVSKMSYLAVQHPSSQGPSFPEPEMGPTRSTMGYETRSDQKALMEFLDQKIRSMWKEKESSRNDREVESLGE